VGIENGTLTVAIYELEQRIYFDAALPVDVAAAASDSQAAEVTDSQTDSDVADSSTESSADNTEATDSNDTPSDVDQEAANPSGTADAEAASDADSNQDNNEVEPDNSVPQVDGELPGDEVDNPKVLLVSSLIQDADSLVAAADSDVLVIKYDAANLSLSELLQEINQALDGVQAESIAIAAHDSGDGRIALTQMDTITLAEAAADANVQQFWSGLGDLLTEDGRIDLLSCNLVANAEGQTLLSRLESLTGHEIAASDDYTGNEIYGGDWILEEGNINVAELYFDSAKLSEFSGTLSAPAMIKDINPSGSSSPYGIVEYNGVMYFNADDGSNGAELWRSDGTDAGTYMLKDINPGSASSSPYELTISNGILFFQANDGVNGAELWKTDGTAAGTTMVKDIYSGSSSSTPTGLIDVNGTLYFSAETLNEGRELWMSNGTTLGTVLVEDIWSGPNSSININAKFNYLSSNTLIFAANNGVDGNELWRSDGTVPGTYMVSDINPISAMSSNPDNFFMWNSEIYFRANNGTNGSELWKTDGTAGGTTMVKDIWTGSNSGLDTAFNVYFMKLDSANSLFFAANDGSTGLELWKTDGTAGGTVQVKDINPGVASSIPQHLYEHDGSYILFGANDGSTGIELWKTDGTAGGTVQVKDINPGSGDGKPENFASLDSNTVVFSAYNTTSGTELWSTNGTTSGTSMVMDIYPGIDSSNPSSLTASSNSKLFFSADDGVHNTQLWGYSPSSSSSDTGSTDAITDNTINDGTDTGPNSLSELLDDAEESTDESVADDVTLITLDPVDSGINPDSAVLNPTEGLILSETPAADFFDMQAMETVFGLPNGEYGVGIGVNDNQISDIPALDYVLSEESSDPVIQMENLGLSSDDLLGGVLADATPVEVQNIIDNFIEVPLGDVVGDAGSLQGDQIDSVAGTPEANVPGVEGMDAGQESGEGSQFQALDRMIDSIFAGDENVSLDLLEPSGNQAEFRHPVFRTDVDNALDQLFEFWEVNDVEKVPAVPQQN
jgi:ELWxxDGT repeat protein